MASAQVMSNPVVSSRNQKNLEAGRRRLEEFRKQKAAKKKAPASQPPATATITSDIQAEENRKIHPLAFEDAGTSGRTGNLVGEPVTGNANDGKVLHSLSRDNGVDPVIFSNISIPEDNIFSFNQPQTQLSQQEHIVNDASGLMNLKNSDYSQPKGTDFGGHGLNFVGGQSIDRFSFKQSNHSGPFRVDKSQLDERNGFLGIAKLAKSYPSGASLGTYDGFSSERHSSINQPALASAVHALDFGQSNHSSHGFCNNLEESDSKLSYQIDDLSGSRDEVQSSLTSRLFKLDVNGSSGQDTLDPPEIYSRRYSPFSLDSLDIPKTSSESSIFRPNKIESMEVPSNASTSATSDFFGRTRDLECYSHVNMNLSGDFTENGFLNENVYTNDYLPQKQIEDFASLEQHIEDLTQEKFSLQRALEASKTLAESLAVENLSLTESYNQQGGVVAQLKADIEQLRGDIKALTAELDSVKIQYTNALLECNAADERAKLLASEVIALEEKTLRLRSNELKLEKELERSNADMISCKRKISSLEKERQDLHQTIDAVKDEKKILQLRLQKASSGGRSLRHFKKDVSTSTEDLDSGILASIHGGDYMDTMSTTSIHDAPDASASSVGDADILSLFPPNGSFHLGASSVMIPPDQLQISENICTLLAELMEEKEELTKALVKEMSASTKLKDLNKEIIRKLEGQTQRLELLTAQKSMASQNVGTQHTVDTHGVQDNVVAYADEGDEVVERVLEWIVKLFPGGPSKRRTSKRL